MTTTDTSKNQIAFALQILKLLAQKPRKREELANLLSEFLEEHGKSLDTADIPQQVTRTIRSLRKCGIKIKSAPHYPYQLQESNFPVILSPQQRQALALAAYFLANMGFSAQAGQIIRIGNLTETDMPPNVKANFSPPVDYSQDNLNIIVSQLQERFRQQRRYTIFYQKSPGKRTMWDIDRSELRFHNGVFYLFAFVPDWHSYQFPTWHNIDQNHLFRIDKILSVNPPSDVHWFSGDFPKLEIHYRMSGQLANYQPRRQGEYVLYRDVDKQYVDIATSEDCLFWFEQRILQYGENAQILEPKWLADKMKKKMHNSYQKYCSYEDA